jgi:hypothetical protein
MGKPYDNALALYARISVCSLRAEAIVNREGMGQPRTCVSQMPASLDHLALSIQLDERDNAVPTG